jgi:hypothetical protein
MITDIDYIYIFNPPNNPSNLFFIIKISLNIEVLFLNNKVRIHYSKMGFLDFFRKKKEPETQKLKFDELGDFIDTKKKNNKAQEQEFVTQVNTKIQELINNLKEKANVLNNIDITTKKVEERAKLIVKENLRNYIFYLEKLIEKLKEVEEENPNTLISKLNNIFDDFEKKSKMSFEKATYLIGKELGQTRDLIIKFSQDFHKTEHDNKELIESSKTISIIENQLNNFKFNNQIKDNINNNIKDFDSKIENLKDQIKNSEQSINETKESEEYKKEIKTKQKINQKKQELDNELYNLKSMIDFKYLANIFHANEKEMAIIKNHKENFLQFFKKDNGEAIVSLLKDTRMETGDVEKKAELLIKQKKDFENLEIALDLLKSKEITDIENKITVDKKEIFSLESEKSREQKKFEKNQEKEKEISDSIKQELANINVEVEG